MYRASIAPLVLGPMPIFVLMKTWYGISVSMVFFLVLAVVVARMACLRLRRRNSIRPGRQHNALSRSPDKLYVRDDRRELSLVVILAAG